MKNILLSYACSMLFVMLASSCGTIIHKDFAKVTFTGNVGEPVTITTADSAYAAQQLPATIRIRRKYLNEPVRFTSDSYLYADIVPGRKYDGTTFPVNFLFTSGAGIIVDALTHRHFLPARDQYKVVAVSKSSDAAKPETHIYGERSYAAMHTSRHEIAIGLGLFSQAGWHHFNHHLDKINNAYKIVDNGCLHSKPAQVSWFLNYSYRFSPRFAAGASLGWAHRKLYTVIDTYDNADFTPVNEMKINSIKHRTFYFMPTATYTWWFFKNTSLYSKIGAGISLQALKVDDWFACPELTTDHTRAEFAFQVTPVGLNIGNGPVGGFIEAGYGAEGIVNIGLKCRFGK